MRRVLMVTFFFPPHPAVGGLRMHGLARFLPEFGWEPTVLTPPLPGEPPAGRRVIQTGYVHKVGKIKRLAGARAKGPSRAKRLLGEVLAYPDFESGWRKPAVKAGGVLLQQEKFNALLSSALPGTCHLIGHDLKASFGIPWIADFRDLWTQQNTYPWSKIRRAVERRLEVKTLKTADALVTVSAPLAEKLGELHGAKRVHSILNGFDPDELLLAARPLTPRFTLTYTGTLYPERRQPELVFCAVRELLDAGSINDIEIRFFGQTAADPKLQERISRFRLQGHVTLPGIVPRSDVLTRQRESQVLLLLNWDDPNEKGIYSAKVFEYLAAQRPILAVGDQQVVGDLLAETRAGAYAPTLETLKAALLHYYREFSSTGRVSYHGDLHAIQRYSQREMARKFAALLDSISPGSL
jgi:hypothetical protein